MKKIYKGILNGAEVYFAREENNSVGNLYQAEKRAEIDDAEYAMGVVVGSEAICMGKSLGFLKDITEIK